MKAFYIFDDERDPTCPALYHLLDFEIGEKVRGFCGIEGRGPAIEEEHVPESRVWCATCLIRAQEDERTVGTG